MQQKVYVVPADQTKDGKPHRFELKPTSIKNRNALNTFMQEYRESLMEKAEAIRHNRRVEALEERQALGDYDGDIPEKYDLPEIDDYDYLILLFKQLTTGPHSQIDDESFDVKFAEAAMRDFLPEAYQTARELTQSLIL